MTRHIVIAVFVAATVSGCSSASAGVRASRTTVGQSTIVATSPSPLAPSLSPAFYLWQQQAIAFSTPFYGAWQSALHDQTDTINAITSSVTDADRSDYWSLLADVYSTFLRRIGPLAPPAGYDPDFATVVKQTQGLVTLCNDVSAHGQTYNKVQVFNLGRQAWEDMITTLRDKIAKDPRWGLSELRY